MYFLFGAYSLTQTHAFTERALSSHRKKTPQKKLKNKTKNVNHIRDSSAAALAKALKADWSVTALNLSDNGDDGAKALAEVLAENPNLTMLDLTNNAIEDKGPLSSLMPCDGPHTSTASSSSAKTTLE